MVAIQKYSKTAGMAATSYTGDSLFFLLDYLLRFLRVVVLLAIWRTILSGRGTVSGLRLSTVLTYTLVAEVFAQQFICETALATAIWEGFVTQRLLWPMGTVGQFAADMVGRWLVDWLLFSVPLLLVAPLLGVRAGPAGLAAGVLFGLSLLLAISVGLALEFIFGSLVVALGQPVWTMLNVRLAISTLLSGSLLPLALLPWGIGAVFGWLPFASVASAPLRIYTGTGSAVPLLLVQAAWSVLLWPLARWIWDANREKLVGYGG